MKIGVYCVFDSVVGAFGSPYYSLTVRHAHRAFIDAYGGRNGNPSDFVLYSLGDFSTDDASFDLLKVPHRLGQLDMFDVKNFDSKG